MADGALCTRPLVFPARPLNRPALPRIGYRIGSYADFRESLIRGLNATPELSHWTHREPDDPGIALLETAAVLGDILTFYQELYANEAFLRTAAWRTSVAELVRLLGYRMAPGLGGSATFAFELRPGAPVTVPAGFGLQVELEGADAPATLETQAELTADPALSRFHLHRPLVEQALLKGATELWLRSDAPIEIAPDDRLLIGTPDAADPDRLTATQIVVVDEVSSLHGATIVAIKGALQLDYPAGAVAYRLGRSFRHFGHSAPAQDVRVAADGTAEASDVVYCRSLSGQTSIGSGALRALDLPLDAAIDDFVAGREVICSYVGGCSTGLQSGISWGGGTFFIEEQAMTADAGALAFVEGTSFYGAAGTLVLKPQPTPDTVVRSVTKVTSASLRVGSLTGPATVLGLDRALSSQAGAGADIRTFAIDETTSPRMQAHARPLDKNAATGRELYFEGPAALAATLAGRRLMLVPVAGEAVATVVIAVATDASGVPGLGGLHRVTLASDVAYVEFPQEPDDETSTIVFGNLADADQGKSEPETVVGSGDGRVAFQTFKLPKAPLTYLQAPEQSPPQAPQLEITVAGRTWTRVESLFGQAPDAEVYIVREDGDGSSWVQFGDGRLFGARLPSGVDNVRARERTGLGAHGPLKENTKVQAGRLDRLQAVQLPGVVSGGAEPEGPDVARAAAPGRVQSLGRLVGLSDFESEALAIPGVALATAAWGLVDGVPTVTVTVLMEAGREQEHAAVAASLRTAARERGADRFEIDVLQGGFRDVRLVGEVAVTAGFDEAAVLGAVRGALGVAGVDGEPPNSGLFGLLQRRFGQPEHATRATGVIQNVGGVAWARVSRFGVLYTKARTKELQRPLACPPDRVLRLVDSAETPGLQLTAVASGVGGGA